MSVSSALIFGNNEYGLEIAKNVTHRYSHITIFSLADIDISSICDFKIEHFDLSDEWDILREKHDLDKSIIFCALNDEAKNIFLTISLRAAFSDITIIITEVLHNILYQDSALKIIQAEVKNVERFNEQYPADIEWSRDHGVLVLSIIHEDMSQEFIYSSKAKHNLIKNGDIFIAVGYEEDLKEFKKFIGDDS